jgi:hypothetical protein
MFIAPATPPDAAIDAELVDLKRRIAAFRAAHAVARPTVGELGRAVRNTDLPDRDPHIFAAVAATAHCRSIRPRSRRGSARCGPGG